MVLNLDDLGLAHKSNKIGSVLEGVGSGLSLNIVVNLDDLGIASWSNTTVVY